jgi:hypothetical protein
VPYVNFLPIQVGLAEMRPAIVHTGGLILLSETFEGDVTRSHNVFRLSLQRMFQSDEAQNLEMQFGAQVEIFCSRENKVSLRFRACSSLFLLL